MIGNIGPWQLLILLVIILLLFGTKKIRNIGSDLGAAMRGFRKGLNEDEPEPRLEADPPEETSAADSAQRESQENH